VATYPPSSGIKLITDQRRSRIIEMVQEHGTLSVDDLVNMLDVSQMTIWRDLVVLDQTGKVRRVRGGVTRLETESAREPFYKNKRVMNKDKKRVIARFAAQHFVQDDDIIILEAGTTAGAMIEFFTQRNLTIMTNGLGNLNDLSCCVPDITIISCGGMLRDVAHTFVGPQAEEFFKSIRAQTLFLSATGLAFPEGITDPNPFEIQVKRAMATSASKVVLLLDSSKFGQRSLTPVIALEKIYALVTDKGAPPEELDKLRSMGLQVFIAS
jgi:DeoR/GlpR family transcriptional regulator of sugar metabolism